MALLSNIAGTEQVALTKINACITTVNLFGGGAVGKIATKSSANDFDIFYAENAFNQKSTTSLAIGTGNKDFDIGGSQWDDDFNFRVRAFSIASPGNYMEGTISALISGYGVKTWRMVVDTVVGSGTFADWQFQVLSEKFTESLTDNSIIGAGNIVDSFASSANITVASLTFNSYQVDNRITLDGKMQFTANSTNPTIIVTLDSSFTRSATDQSSTGFYPVTIYNITDDILSSGYLSQSTNALNFIQPLTYISGKSYSVFFQISYTVA